MRSTRRLCGGGGLSRRVLLRFWYFEMLVGFGILIFETEGFGQNLIDGVFVAGWLAGFCENSKAE